MLDPTDLSDMIEFSPAEKVKKMIFQGENFNVALICLDTGQEIPVHPENYDVFFFTISGTGIFTIGKESVKMEKGSMVFSPAGERGIKALEQLVVLGIQAAH